MSNLHPLLQEHMQRAGVDGQMLNPAVTALLKQVSATYTRVERCLADEVGVASRLLPILLGRQHCRILMLGLDAAGKTTLLYQLKLGEHTATVPTLGFNVETVSYRNIEFMVWDMGGQDKIRQLWSHYYEGTQALIFVVDSADAERMDEARQELHKLMEQEELKDAVLLVYANKQDVAGALSVQQVAESLQLLSLIHI